MTVRVSMWSGPRNISTAMMRSFENRPDTVVVDEPFYAAYLAHTGIDHPGRDDVLASQPTDAARVVAALQSDPPEGIDVVYAKQMSHHVDDSMDLSWTLGQRNVLLIRDPDQVVASYVRSRQACEPADIGVLQQLWLLELWGSAGATPPVIDADDFLRRPEAHLRWLCDWLGIAFTDAMLSWPDGTRDSDGVWAPYWYTAVRRSTGFEPWRAREISLSQHDAAVAAACRPAYEELRARRLPL
ncbi:MAG TPA: HAD family hydrolase [Nocardioidaceae bacterium]|nr:HAD family hydrolase [Nocardioidaceae bacterium]